MKSEKLWKFIHFGGCLSFLKSVKNGYFVHGSGYILNNIDRLLENIDELDLKVTKQILGSLKRFKEEIENTPEDYKISMQDSDKLFKIMDKLKIVIQAETSTHQTFFITDKRIDVNKLIYNIGSLMAPNIYNSLTNIIKYDFKESGKCIAFECATAAAFHVLRGIEGLLRILLKSLNPKVNINNINWGEIISELKNLNISELKIILDNLDNIRYNYRNPTNHPEKIYNIEEAQDLFNLCVGVVNQVSKYMKDNDFL